MPYGSEGVVSRSLPQKNSDQLPLPPRLGPYRDAKVEVVLPNFAAAADEGSYFATTNVTPGTALGFVSSSAFADTTALLVVRNGDSATNPSAKRVFLDYVKVIQGANLPTAAVSAQYAIKIDAGLVRDSNGTALTPGNVNMDVAVGSVAKVTFAPTMAAATSNARLVDRGVIRSNISIQNDSWIWGFGTIDKNVSTTVAPSLPSTIAVNSPPVILGPGETMALHVWFPSSTGAPNFEVALGWYER